MLPRRDAGSQARRNCSSATLLAMSDFSGQASADRYDVSGNAEAQYIDAAQQILKNKRGITELRALQVEEEKALAVTYERLLAEVLADTPITADLIRHAHDAIFGGLYE